MAPLAVPLVVAGTGLTAYGQLQQSQAAAAEAKASQAMHEYNARLQERQAKQMEARAELEQKRQYQAGQRQMASLSAAMGKAGVVPTAGTPLLLQAVQASELELENLLIGQESMERAQALRSGAALSGMESAIARQRERYARTAGYFGAGATLLSGLGSAAYFGASLKKPFTWT